MEVDFDTYVIQAARYCGTNYRCGFEGGNCGAIFHAEYEIVEHLRRAESEGGHETEMRNRYNGLDQFYASVRPQADYNEEDPIARPIFEEEVEPEVPEPSNDLLQVTNKNCAGNSEGKGEHMIEESIKVAYDMIPEPKVPEPSKDQLEEFVIFIATGLIEEHECKFKELEHMVLDGYMHLLERDAWNLSRDNSLRKSMLMKLDVGKSIHVKIFIPEPIHIKIFIHLWYLDLSGLATLNDAQSLLSLIHLRYLDLSGLATLNDAQSFLSLIHLRCLDLSGVATCYELPQCTMKLIYLRYLNLEVGGNTDEA